jgi:hypothetical protein
MQRSRKRYYSEDDFEHGVTRSQLKRMGRERQIEYMRYWFGRNFEDPAQETPYNSEEGGYLYIWGGPYDASEELFDEFGEFVPEDRIQAVVDDVESDGLTDWAPGTDHPDHERARAEWAEERDREEVGQSPLTEILAMLERGTEPRFGGQEERAQRRAILSRLEALESELEALKPAHGGIGHNRPPEDDGAITVIEDAQEAAVEIRTELVKDTPDALVVARATSRLQTAIGWLLKKVDTAADAFAKTIGAAAATGAAVVVGGYATKALPKLAELANDVVAKTTDWLQNVTLPF